MKSASPRFSSAEQRWLRSHRRALAEWQGRYEAATTILERLALFHELNGRLRPDIWREPAHPDAHLGALDA